MSVELIPLLAFSTMTIILEQAIVTEDGEGDSLGVLVDDDAGTAVRRASTGRIRKVHDIQPALQRLAGIIWRDRLDHVDSRTIVKRR